MAPSSQLAVELVRQWAADRTLRFEANALLGNGAVLSTCGGFRYLLWRHANPATPFIGFGMLNPSTADHESDDPTIQRCIGRASRMHGALLVWNLFALRATDPDVMKRADDPVGEYNDAVIDLALGLTSTTIAAWGTDGGHRNRQRAVLKRCGAAEARLHALKLTKGGYPGHPLYIGSSVDPVEWIYDWE